MFDLPKQKNVQLLYAVVRRIVFGPIDQNPWGDGEYGHAQVAYQHYIVRIVHYHCSQTDQTDYDHEAP